MSEIQKQFEQDLAEVDWKSVRLHLQRDALILLDPELDLVEVALHVAEDRASQVSAWIASGQLRKPAQEEIELWEKQPDKPFKMLIVQPYILLQQVDHA